MNPLRAIAVNRERWEQGYPFSVPAFATLERLEFPTAVTLFAGENGSGKSTLLEGLARALDYPLEGGSNHMKFAATRQTATMDLLARALRLQWSKSRTHSGFFLRAESMHHVAGYLDGLAEEDTGALRPYGGRSLHEQSHGESFLATIQHRCSGPGLYLFDEPEAALSPARQLTLLAEFQAATRKPGRQFVMATHSPILLAFPGATIYQFTPEGIASVAYRETSSYQVMRDFLAAPDRMLGQLLKP